MSSGSPVSDQTAEMDFWEFLVQREGDQSWLPLGSAQVEILEGRYRMMAHTSHRGQPVDIQVSQVLLDQMPPRRRVRKRQAQTSEKGLLAILPFTWLSAGIWEVYCSPQFPATDQPGKRGVQLRVLAHAHGDEDEGDWPDAGETLGPEGSDIPDWLPMVSPAATTEVAPVAPAAVGSTSQAPAGSCCLSLVETVLRLPAAAAFTLAGDLQGIDIPTSTLLPVTLVVKLIDPQTCQVVTEASYSYQVSSTATPFQLALSLPSPLNTHLLLGEIYMTSAQRPDPPDLLQTFTVTVGIEQLLQSLSGMDLPGTPPAIAVPPVLAEERAGEDSPPVADGAEVDEDVAFSAEWEETIEAEPPRVDLPLPEGFTTKPRFRSVPRSPLPPQIRPVGDAVVKSRFPVLPDLPKPSPAIGPLASSTGSLAGSAGLVPDSPPDDQPIPAEVDGQSPAAWVDPPLMPDPPPVDLSPADLSQVESVDSPVDQAFQSLHLENRFLSRLNALAEDRRQAAQNVETSASLASRAEDRLPGEAETTPVADRPSQIPEGAREMSADAMATVESIDWSQLTGTSSESASAEIVIYEDELLEPHTSLEIADLEAVTNDGQATELLPDDALDLLPVPELILPSGELVADTPITVEVAVPTPAARVGVKLWLCDRQTRLLLDEPRWLLDLQPDAAGMLRASLKMTIPLGCQEARFEAISVDLVTQAESHKAVSDRMVIPPDLPDASLEEFEL